MGRLSGWREVAAWPGSIAVIARARAIKYQHSPAQRQVHTGHHVRVTHPRACYIFSHRWLAIYTLLYGHIHIRILLRRQALMYELFLECGEARARLCLRCVRAFC
jgi:hypothetical protein